jgi:hypothetical protein
MKSDPDPLRLPVEDRVTSPGQDPRLKLRNDQAMTLPDESVVKLPVRAPAGAVLQLIGPDMMTSEEGANGNVVPQKLLSKLKLIVMRSEDVSPGAPGPVTLV